MREHTKMIPMNAADYVQIRRPSVGNYMYEEDAREGGSIRYQSRRFKEAREQGLGSTRHQARNKYRVREGKRRSLVDGMEVIVTSLPCNLIGWQEGRTWSTPYLVFLSKACFKLVKRRFSMENMTWLVNHTWFFLSEACFKLVKCGFPMESMAYLVNTLLGAFICKVLYHGEYGLLGQHPTWCVYS